MTSIFIHLQILTIIKAHKECAGPLKGVANSMIKYSHPSLLCVWSDDPLKVSSLRLSASLVALIIISQDSSLYIGAWMDLANGLTPMAAAHGLDPLVLLMTAKIKILGIAALADRCSVITACTFG